ncbi:chemosensory receptor b [Plakobranchus ocellatus]|uniref:Chemosensory receptor b n=1 Tax=Plakobranchus ocellatus TaxID=259542 RepID=A0AAV4BBJ5_9GAST|nr:chemosensory receptor b [Plakobranchus ocellatus]
MVPQSNNSWVMVTSSALGSSSNSNSSISSILSTTTIDNRPIFISDSMREKLEIVFFVVMSGGISFVGSFANIINMVVFLKQGFSDTMNISLFALALSDFGSLITLVWMAICFVPDFRFHPNIPFETTQIQYLSAGWPHMLCARSGSLITAFITFERCICIALPLRVKSIITPRRTIIVIASIFGIMVVSVMPIYYGMQIGPTFLEDRNKTLLAIVYAKGGHEIESIGFAVGVVAQIGSFVLVVIFTVILLNSLVRKSRWRKTATSGDGTASGSGAEKSNRDKRVMVMVVTISGIFIACFMPSAINVVLIILWADYNIVGRLRNLFQVTGSICNACESINCSINIIVYYKMSSKFRLTFREMFHLKNE